MLSLSEDGLHLGVQRLPLCCLAIHSTEPCDAELFARLLYCIDPLLQRARSEPLLRVCRLSLADDPAVLVLHQCVLCQASDSLLPFASEDKRFGELASRDLTHLLDLLHGL